MAAPVAAAAAAWQATSAAKSGGKGPKLAAGIVGGVLLLLLALTMGGGVVTFVSQVCSPDDEGGGGESVEVGPVTEQAKRDIPTSKGDSFSGGGKSTVTTLDSIVRLSKEMDIDWHFVASISAQECNFGRCLTVSAVNGSGCIGPMQLGVGGACGDFFGDYKTDGDGDGKISPTDPEDAVATAITGLKEGKGAPGRGGSYQEYRQAACGYYGACADGSSDYANEVMSRAVAYGFEGPGAPDDPEDILAQVEANAAPTAPAAEGEDDGCGGGSGGGGSEEVGELGEGDPSGEALLRNDRIELDERATADIRAKNISPRLIALLDAITQKHRITISVLNRGHAPGTNHEPGRAADIAIVDGEVCNANAKGREGKCWQLMQELDEVRGCFRSTELIYYYDPSPDERQFSFAKADHADHIHMGFRGPTGSTLTYDPDGDPCGEGALNGR